MEVRLTAPELKRLLSQSACQSTANIMRQMKDAVLVKKEMLIGQWLVDEVYTIDLEEYINDLILLIESVVEPYYNSTHYTTKRLECLIVDDLIALVLAIEAIGE